MYSFCHISCVFNCIKSHYLTLVWACFYTDNTGSVLAWYRATFCKGSPDLSLLAVNCSDLHLEQPSSEALYLVGYWWKWIGTQCHEKYAQITSSRATYSYISFSVLSHLSVPAVGSPVQPHPSQKCIYAFCRSKYMDGSQMSCSASWVSGHTT